MGTGQLGQESETGPLRVRAFFGLPVPDAQRALLERYLAECVAKAAQFRWTPAANLHLTANFYMRSVIDTVKYNDLASGIGKTFFFGFAVGLIACYNGLRTTGGADGVGRSTTVTVVMSAITVLIMDFFLTKLFLLAF